MLLSSSVKISSCGAHSGERDRERERDFVSQRCLLRSLRVTTWVPPTAQFLLSKLNVASATEVRKTLGSFRELLSF